MEIDFLRVSALNDFAASFSTRCSLVKNTHINQFPCFTTDVTVGKITTRDTVVLKP